jgi:hypothetical protein
MNKRFYITRLEESRVLKKVEYEIIAPNKRKAIKQLNRMEYVLRDTADEIQEDDWKPREIISVEEDVE